ncbi:DUF2252 domain-containing protein [Streptomyces sp. NPDC059740]|uniref:DUF2252 domain-containing protein n=1 Tax=Streptomyces sp. NPDC059740 TaxID=3346926 RepID=UPI00364CEC6A
MTRVPHVRGFARLETTGRGAEAAGKAIRRSVPRSQHARVPSARGRPDVVTVLEASHTGRLPELAPLRWGRMAASPYAFYRGAAAVMARDLGGTPVTGVGTRLCGDAHLGNFGLFADARGRLVLDLDDFDETVHGPWEWDLKRLATSFVLAGREAGGTEDTCRDAARQVVCAYRKTVRLLARLPVLEAWQALSDESLLTHADARGLLAEIRRAADKAHRNTSSRFAAKATSGEGEARRFVEAPPVLRRVPDEEAAAVAGALTGYLRTVPHECRLMLARHTVQDVAFRVVGTGSVGLRSYVVLLSDPVGKPLVLQVKQAAPASWARPATAAGFPQPRWGNDARRVVLGQRHLQVAGDPLLGWTSVPLRGPGNGGGQGTGMAWPGADRAAGTDEAGGADEAGGTGVGAGAAPGFRVPVGSRAFQVRQFRNRKGRVETARLSPPRLVEYARLTGTLLARAHARGADARRTAGYCGKGERLDEAVADFAVAYADRTEADHGALLKAIAGGRLAVEQEG